MEKDGKGNCFIFWHTSYSLKKQMRVGGLVLFLKKCTGSSIEWKVVCFLYYRMQSLISWIKKPIGCWENRIVHIFFPTIVAYGLRKIFWKLSGLSPLASFWQTAPICSFYCCPDFLPLSPPDLDWIRSDQAPAPLSRWDREKKEEWKKTKVIPNISRTLLSWSTLHTVDPF